MAKPKVVTIDFETEAIQSWPQYPPKPVGVSIMLPNEKKAKYYAWGHPTGNNCSEADGHRALQTVWKSNTELLCHNAKFDLDVAETHLGLALPSWDRIHDTMFLVFLADPHSPNLKLKPAAERLLKLPPEEQDILRDWCIAQRLIAKNAKEFGHLICLAPGDLVGRYANGDVIRTRKLFDLLYPQIVERGMLGAYNRERQLLPILLRNEHQGVQVDYDLMEQDDLKYEKAQHTIDAWLRKQLKVGSEFNLDSDDQLADALVKQHKADPDLFLMTPTGKRSTAKDSLIGAVTDPKLLSGLQYRARLSTAYGTFLHPWFLEASACNGIVHPSWNQVRQAGTGKDTAGARTGRLSASRFMNVPKEFKERSTGGNAYKHPGFIKGLPELPFMRLYMKPFKGEVWCKRDYCFSADTEVLTEAGWVRFDELNHQKLAQYHNGVISYAEPLAHQVLSYAGDMVHITGPVGTSVDLLVTPDHNCLLFSKTGVEYRMPAAEYPVGNGCRFQVHAGVLEGGEAISHEALALACAIQADAAVIASKTKPCLIKIKVSKPRKIAKLVEILSSLAIAYKQVQYESSAQYTWFIFGEAALPESVAGLLSFTASASSNMGKEFTRKLLSLSLEARLYFLHELAFWDGSRISKTCWYYGSTCQHNVDLVQELAAISGLRAMLHKWPAKTGRKDFWQVSIRTTDRTSVRRYISERIAYTGKVYCVTMPYATVIVRRNGKVSVTGQCQQELRVLGHFGDGELMHRFAEDPGLDVHDLAANLIVEKFGLPVTRGDTKTIGFGLLYGMGLGSLAERLGVDMQTAKKIKQAYLSIFPELEELQDSLKQYAKSNKPLRTWGGREYYVEPPKFMEKRNRVVSFEYKLLNYLIQGSSADCTKEALIRYDHAKKDGRFLLVVHDEINISVPPKAVVSEMKILFDVMKSIEFDVLMLSDGGIGPNWGTLEAAA